MRHCEQDLGTASGQRILGLPLLLSLAIRTVGEAVLPMSWRKAGRTRVAGSGQERVLTRVINKQQMRKREPEKCRGADSGSWGI